MYKLSHNDDIRTGVLVRKLDLEGISRHKSLVSLSAIVILNAKPESGAFTFSISVIMTSARVGLHYIEVDRCILKPSHELRKTVLS